MSAITKDFTTNFLLTAPPHPGEAVEGILMKNFNIDLDTLSKKSSIALSTLGDFTQGNIPINDEIKTGLSKVFHGRVISMLEKMQFNYDYFQSHGHRPPRGHRPK